LTAFDGALHADLRNSAFANAVFGDVASASVTFIDPR